MTQQITAKSWAMIAILGLVWGGTFLFIEMALEGITPIWLASARIAFAALLSLAVWQMRGGRLFTSPDRGKLTHLLLIGAMSSAMPFMLISWGQQYVTSAFAGVTMAGVILFVLPMAHFLIPGERITLRRAVGILVGFGGVLVLFGAEAFDSTGAGRENVGRLAILGATACYATNSILMHRLPPVDPIGLSAVLLLIGASLVIPIAFVVEGPPVWPDPRTLAILAALGLIPTAAANFLRVMVVRSAGPTFMSLTNYMVPVWSVLLGALVLGEALPTSLFAALALILTGVAISQFGALTRLFRPQ